MYPREGQCRTARGGRGYGRDGKGRPAKGKMASGREGKWRPAGRENGVRQEGKWRSAGRCRGLAADLSKTRRKAGFEASSKNCLGDCASFAKPYPCRAVPYTHLTLPTIIPAFVAGFAGA